MDKNPVSLSLINATAEDAQQLYTWFTDLQQIQYWGGPDLDYPLSLADFIQRTKIDSLASVKLVDDAHRFLAFGQYYLRAGKVHFGRLAVCPGHRGLGIGRKLISALMQQAPKHIHGEGFSLFVMADNRVAKNLYESVGFRLATYPEPLDNGLANFLYMIADPF